MSSISSLSRAFSGLSASQQALHTTAHNLGNVNTPGYVRQQVLMKDATYLKVGNSGNNTLMVGLGTDIQDIRQVRDMFLDAAFREEASRYGFYSGEYDAINEIETILGETEGQGMSKLLTKVYASLNGLTTGLDTLENRGVFVQTAVQFVNKANLIMEQLQEYQLNLNQQVKDKVNEINQLGEEIHRLNGQIVKYESNGDNANDYRDARNYALDKLSTHMNISYREDKLGNVLVKAEGMEFVTLGGITKMGVKQAVAKSPMVNPVWEESGIDVYNLDEKVSPAKGNDRGELKGLLLARGSRSATWADANDATIYEKEVKPSLIMSAQAKFDKLVHAVVTTVNDVIAPKDHDTTPPKAPPWGLDKTSQFIEIFKRKNMDRYNAADVHIAENASDYNTLYTAGNLEINQEVLNDYNKICLAKDKNGPANNESVLTIMEKWKDTTIEEDPGSATKHNIDEYYKSYIGDVGNRGQVVIKHMENQRMLVTQIDNKRSSLMGVSSDEELGNMMKYQHAYNASARVVTTVDEMLETIISRLGLVGR